MTKDSTEPVETDALGNTRARWLYVFVCAAVLVVGLVVRIGTIGQQALHFDEGCYFNAAKQPTLAGVIASSRRQTHPPGAFLLFHAFRGLGDSEFAVRIPSTIFFVTSIAVAFVWFHRQFGPWPALLGAAVLVGARPYAKLSVEMRGYTWLLTLVFAAMLLRDRFLRTGALTPLVGSTVCLLLALFTHYSIVLLLLVLGIATLVRFPSGELTRGAMFAWCGSQLALLGGCGVLLAHVGKFRTSTLWVDWLADSAFDPTRTAPAAMGVLRGLEFLGFLVGFPAWILVAPMILVGAAVACSRVRRETGSDWAGAERALLLVLPWIVAIAGFHLRVYPIGRTRHAMWLLPFLATAVAASVAPLARRRPGAAAAAIVLGLVVWFGFHTLPALRSPIPDWERPESHRRFAAAIREHVPEGALVLTDTSTMWQLDFYLAGGESGRDFRRDDRDGWIEHEMAGRRIVEMPVFYAALLDERLSSAVSRHLSPEGTWMVWRNRGFPSDRPESVLPKLGIRDVLELHTVGESWLVLVPRP